MLLDLPFPPFQVLGYTVSGLPVLFQAGGAPEEGETEIEVETDADPEADPEAEGEAPEAGDDDEKTKLRAALKKANGEAASYRRQLKEAKKQAAEAATEEVEEEAAASGTELTPAQLKRAVDKAVKTATEAAEARYRPVAIHAAAESAFVTAGAKAAGVAKLVRLIDTEDIEVDMATGKVTAGLDEQIEDLKAEFPELFTAAEPAKPAKRPAPKKAAQAQRPEPQEAPKSTAERMADAILGR